MTNPENGVPDLGRLRGVISSEILSAVEVASAELRKAGVPHALAGGLAVCAHGYPRTTDDVDFLVGDEAFLKHAGGLVTLRLPLIAIGGIRIDFVSIDESRGEFEHMRPAVDAPLESDGVPVVPLPALVYMKLKAGRQKDLADLVELLKRGRIDVPDMDAYLGQHAPNLASKWESTKKMAAAEE